ncbi:DUF2244 domain-containing protein [Pseudoduganella sp. FT25W]|uniref:DUF2244 domain-containing protein n=1 Tax=Duganella alba TaxID=2666081 RepID=A0A6L5QDR4_9BURK|nr:DUF2244 domain-containing protein [Duganella alba]MRX07877.1 DUF2244 domain-containing protein [Duganella alba]MRX15480.1 DUF2244 domain-containing protein [Duganella alba]
MPREGPSGHRSWLLQRRYRLSRRQLTLLFAALCVPSLTVAGGFLWFGYWYILAYSVLELSVVALCLRHHARHAADYDRIDITPAAIHIAQRRALVERRIELNPQTARVLAPSDSRLQLADGDIIITLAEFLPPSQRQQLSNDLALYISQR